MEPGEYVSGRLKWPGITYALPDDNHGKNSRGKGKIDRDHDQTPSERVVSLQDSVFGDGKNDGRKSTCNSRGNDPRGADLSHTLSFPSPNDTINTDRSDTHTDDCTNNAVGCRDRKTDGSGNREPG
jgi:hypothetical protein